MARTGKKETLLTPEEKLAQALVPEAEQPYQIPENWCWTKMSTVAQWGAGGTPSRKNPEYYEGNIPWIKTGELEDDYLFDTEEHITEEAISNSSAKLFPVNTVVIAMYGATIGKVGILGINAATNQACACGVCSSALFYKYLFYYARSQKDAFIRKAKGGAQPNISQEIIKSHPIPIPPLAEQQRIVDRIESLFTKLNEAKEKAQAIVDGFEDRKAAILHKAFMGELTEKWRKTGGFARSITNQSLHELCTKITDGFHNSPKPVKAGYPYVMAGNVHEVGVDYYNGLYVDEKNHRELYKKAHPEKGDILVVNIGASTGRAAIIETDIEFSFKNCAILKVDKRKVNPQYILFFIWLNKDYWLKEITRGGAQPFLSLKMLNQIEIPMVSLQEQTQVVETVNSLIMCEQQVKETAEQVIDQIDMMKKSILARAFRGELGTNDPSDESAEELLSHVLQ